MKMEMGFEQLIPGVQYADKTEFATKAVFWILAKGKQGLGYGFEQNVEHDFFVE